MELARAGVSRRFVADTSLLGGGVGGRAATGDGPFIPIGRVTKVGLLRDPLRSYAPLASLVIPGSGQFILGNDRSIGYIAVEAIGWWRFVKDARDRATQERSYKDLARRVARVSFSNVLPDGDWLYYEWMRDDKESGRFSLALSGPTLPDTSAETYNGKRWRLARNTQPTYEAALAQYESEAIRPEYAWSWTNAQFQWDIYKRITDKRNDAARAAVKDLLLIGANHFISMIDAFATFRLQIENWDDGRTSVGATIRW